MLLIPGWCADAGYPGPFAYHALSPCLLDSVLTVLTPLLCALSLAIGYRRIKQISNLRSDAGAQHGPLGATGMEGGFAACAAFITLLHAAHLAASLWIGLPLFHVFMHASMALAWTVVLVASAWACGPPHVPLKFAFFGASTCVCYLVSLYTFFAMYNNDAGYPAPYVRSSIWTLLLQVVVTVLLVVLDVKRQKGVKSAPGGYVELPDEETAAASGAQGRTGLSLFWDACRYVWPEDPWLQVRALASLGLLLLMRVLNLAVPILFKHMVDSLAGAGKEDGGGGSTAGRWAFLSVWTLLYLGALFFQGGAGGGMIGFINNIRQVLWIPVGQDAFRRISLRVFDHVLNMDLAFHLSRKTGEVTKQIDRGTNAMQNILSTIMFSILPTLIDVLAASTYLAQALEPSIAIIVFFTIGSYVPITVIITEYRGSLRRDMNRTDQVQAARMTDALLNYETVKYFTAEQHETRQYANALGEYQQAEFKSMASLNLLNCVQSFIMFAGIATGLLVCTAGVYRGGLTVGDVVLFVSLMGQLYAPLNWFGSYYRTIQQYMIDMENLFQLLDKKSAVVDVASAKQLVVSEGRVEFDRVTFEYEPGNPVLKNVSWAIEGGKTIAFVGATGSGKSTITRLIFRFYDVSGGAVRIDGTDIRNVTQQTLRRAIGMVPQDTVLFNDTILTNIRYGNLDASDEQVYEAAQAACIHEAITTRFPKGYGTIVGERGLRLSGGEKQRVAFARAILKNPQILVLDEATSALDTITERKIQSALTHLRQRRTTLIVAHRLSTIVDADRIVVLGHGEVLEVGSHKELLEKQGVYADMWSRQSLGLDGEGSTDDAGAAAGASASGTASTDQVKGTAAASGEDSASSVTGGTGRGGGRGGRAGGRGRGAGRGSEAGDDGGHHHGRYHGHGHGH